MTHDPACRVPDEHHFADWWPDIGLQRNSAQGEVKHFAIDDLTRSTGELGGAFCFLAIVAPQQRGIHQIVVHVECQLLGELFALQRGALETNSEIACFGTYCGALEAAEFVDVDDDGL